MRCFLFDMNTDTHYFKIWRAPFGEVRWRMLLANIRDILYKIRITVVFCGGGAMELYHKAAEILKGRGKNIYKQTFFVYQGGTTGGK